jgi:hypothetical protein
VRQQALTLKSIGATPVASFVYEIVQKLYKIVDSISYLTFKSHVLAKNAPIYAHNKKRE